MSQYLLIVVSAFIMAAGLTPLARWVAPRVGLMDQPAARKIHARPMPLIGGVAIYLAFIASLVLLGDRGYVQEVISIFAGATLCSFVGLWDDRVGLPALLKLGVQMLAAGILILSGVRTQLPWLGPLNLAVTLLWIVGVTNAINLLDNMDGLAGGVSAVAAAFFLLLAAMHGQYLVGALAAGLLGAAIGFLVYNLNPASVFMGDSGSLFLGFMLAAVGLKLRFPGQPTTITWMIPLIVLGLPIFDTSLVFLSRLRRGLNPLTTPGKDHTSHRLLQMGYTRREAVLVLYLIGCALGVLAMYLTQSSATEALVVGLLLVAAALFAIFALERRMNAPIDAVAAAVSEPSTPTSPGGEP
jgi:UDP-GlcNAc:undecaprenyl-phosphate/decaprenyl-phosphate GlcNAc-1-phosphate transferase